MSIKEKDTLVLSYQFGIKEDANYQTPSKYHTFRDHVVDGFKAIVEENAAKIIPDKDLIYTIQISSKKKVQSDKVQVSKNQSR
jgi:hypothetical protein